ncbi:MAG: crossover junction endodeoxyribonuclease RuvC [Bacteroidetes bacterium RIFCSPLOWO2_12_FULL_31_6]|nr:MAG: crossover junction endodeoxyribonuclease RuvC [Bacteroidetes bacterium RIFCSPLOWO2_12_FULL_31_6]
MGYGIIHIKNNNMSLIAMGSIELNKLETHFLKLKKIFERTQYLINEYKPDELAIEAPFMGKNPQSMLKLGRAQGISMAVALSNEIPVSEYAPRKIKQSITGKGTASKEQVAAMLVHLLKLKSLPNHLDATDGLAVAVCHYFQMGKVESNKTYSGWESFVKNNPKRTKS